MHLGRATSIQERGSINMVKVKTVIHGDKMEVKVSFSWCPVEGDTVQLMVFPLVWSSSPTWVNAGFKSAAAQQRCNSVAVILHSSLIPLLPLLWENRKGALIIYVRLYIKQTDNLLLGNLPGGRQILFDCNFYSIFWSNNNKSGALFHIINKVSSIYSKYLSLNHHLHITAATKSPLKYTDTVYSS